MTPTEKLFATWLLAQGYTVLNRGWPDLIAYRDGELRLIEVKSGKDKLSESQQKCHILLQKAGLDVEVVRPDKAMQNADVTLSKERAVMFLKQYLTIPMSSDELISLAARHGVRRTNLFEAKKQLGNIISEKRGYDWWWVPKTEAEIKQWNEFEKELQEAK